MSEAARDEATLRSILRTRTSEVGAVQKAFELASRSGGLALGAAVVLGVLAGIGEWAASQAAIEVKTWSAETLRTTWQLGSAVTAFLALYAALQFTKRETASVESWLPALFALPVLCLTGGFAAANGSTIPITEVLFFNAFTIVFTMVAGAPVLMLWIRAGQAAATGSQHDLGETLIAIRERVQQVMVIRGAKFQAILVGAQVVLPGIFYALQLAYAEIIAVLQPERPALRRSGQLTWGMRGRLFRLLALMIVPSNLLVIATLVAVRVITGGEGTAAEQASQIVQAWVFDPGVLGMSGLIIQDVILTVAWWLTLLAVLVLFNEREAQIQAKRELKRLLEAAKKAEEPAAESDASPA